MGDLLDFKRPKPLKGFIPDSFVDNLPPINLAEPIFDPRKISVGYRIDITSIDDAPPEKEPA
jgi:hypothetical protein